MMNEKKTYTRFTIDRRIEHILLILSFSTLAITGLVQKFVTFNISEIIVGILGGIETTRIIHRIAAIMFITESIYHFVILGYKMVVLRVEATMMLDFKDAQDGIQAFLYNLGFRKETPKMGRYNFAEKMEYMAMLWGLVMMALTGFILWNPIAISKILPGQIIPAAKVAHGWEAVLAVLAIIVWHFYNVHLKRFNLSMFTGELTKEEMEEEHSLELEAIEKGELKPLPPPETIKKRSTIYFPIAIIISIAIIFGLYRFLTFEETAITTLPPVTQDIPAYLPRTATPRPTPTPIPTAVAGASFTSWESGIASSFIESCSSCHSEVASYQEAIDSGFIVPGDPEASSAILIQREGGHMGQFDNEILSKIEEWISASAPENQ